MMTPEVAQRLPYGNPFGNPITYPDSPVEDGVPWDPGGVGEEEGPGRHGVHARLRPPEVLQAARHTLEVVLADNLRRHNNPAALALLLRHDDEPSGKVEAEERGRCEAWQQLHSRRLCRW